MSATDHLGEMCLCHTAKECAITHAKASGTLANNLCPDHRDKQQGKPCLACAVEQLQRALSRALAGKPVRNADELLASFPETSGRTK